MYRKELDFIKGISILAVIFYHFGLLKSGYLGVDTFFVVNGFLLVPSLLKDENLNFFSFIYKRLKRLYPLVVLATLVCMVLGYFTLMPHAYEQLSKSTIASNLMSENILSYREVQNYWDSVNEFKPLMHLWFVGIIFEFYIIIPLVLYFSNTCSKLFNKDKQSTFLVVLCVFTGLSLVLYLLPESVSGNKFYFIHTRFWELGIGGIFGLLYRNNVMKLPLHCYTASVIALVLLFASSLLYLCFTQIPESTYVIGVPMVEIHSGLPLPRQMLLVLVVAFSCIAVSSKEVKLKREFVLSQLGKMSYSFFIWHQIVMAFYRNCISTETNFRMVITVLTITLLFSVITYNLIETNKKKIYAWGIASILLVIGSVFVYKHKGAFEDIPELGFYTENRGNVELGTYCDRIYDYDKDFSSDNTDERIKVLVVGVSFARDFANILLESKYKNNIELSYSYSWDEKDISNRLKRCDYLFYFGPKKEVPQDVFGMIKAPSVLWGIGTKSYGVNNGPIFIKRKTKEYFNLTNVPEKGYLSVNKEWKEQWQGHFVDLMSMAMMPNGNVRVFTPDHYYIAPDCRHLSPKGAQWYARIIDWENIFKI